MHTGVRMHAGIFGCPHGVQDCVPRCAHTGTGFWGACRHEDETHVACAC